jgi:hypothetical protein
MVANARRMIKLTKMKERSLMKILASDAIH